MKKIIFGVLVLAAILVISGCAQMSPETKQLNIPQQQVGGDGYNLVEKCSWHRQIMPAPSYANGGWTTLTATCDFGEVALTGTCTTRYMNPERFVWASCGYVEPEVVIDSWRGEMTFYNFTSSPSYNQTITVSVLCCSP